MWESEGFSERLSEASLERRRRATSRKADLFVRPVPVAWIRKAATVNPTAVLVGLAVWFRSGCERSDKVRIGHSVLAQFGISRQQGYRGLAALESVGLVKVERHRGCNPVVTILQRKSAAKGRKS